MRICGLALAQRLLTSTRSAVMTQRATGLSYSPCADSMLPASPFEQILKRQKEAQLHVECQLELASPSVPAQLLHQRKAAAAPEEGSQSVTFAN